MSRIKTALVTFGIMGVGFAMWKLSPDMDAGDFLGIVFGAGITGIIHVLFYTKR